MKDVYHTILYRGCCILAAASLIGKIGVDGKKLIEKKLCEESLETSIETNLNEDTTAKEVINYSDEMAKKHLKVGAYVKVYDRGNEISDGTGNLGCSWNGEEMMIVDINKNSKYPYACAIVDSTPGEEDIVGWFKFEDLKPLTKDFVFYKDATEIKNEDGTITYVAPEGYILCNESSKSCMKITRKYIFSDYSKEEIIKKYSI